MICEGFIGGAEINLLFLSAFGITIQALREMFLIKKINIPPA
jgi:hypothetical protein